MRRTWLLVAIAAGCHYDLDAVDRPGGDDGGPVDAMPSDQPNIVFLTSVVRAPPNFGGIEGADTLCQDLADDSDLPAGTYRAWLSIAGMDARDRLGSARGWVRPDGLPFADRVSDIVAGRILYPAALDEDRMNRTGDEVGALVATGTAADGTATGEDCGGFQSNAGSLRFGHIDGGTALWTDADTLNCTTDMRIYCFGTDRAAPVAIEPDDGARLAFITAEPFAAGTGLEAADAACATDAAAAGFSRTFSALLATGDAPAIDRFEVTSDRPWFRVDGVRVTDDFAALEAALNVTADGESYLSGQVWNGAPDPDQMGTATCVDWSDGTDGAVGQVGEAARSSSEAFGGVGTHQCNSPDRLYCLEL